MECLRKDLREWLFRVTMWSLLGVSVPMILFGAMDIWKPHIIGNPRSTGRAFMIAGVTLFMLTSLSLWVCFNSCCQGAEGPLNNATLLQVESSLSTQHTVSHPQVPVYNQHTTYQLLTYPLDPGDQQHSMDAEAPPSYHEVVSLMAKVDPAERPDETDS